MLSADEQTPLTTRARRWSRKLEPGVQRVRIPEGAGNTLLYTGELFRELLLREGFLVPSEKISIRSVRADDMPVYIHSNTRTLREVIAAMMLYSNNFIANQILLGIGMSVHGLPATPGKGLRVLRSYMLDNLGLDNSQFRIVEGSGLSRKNLITPTALWAALRKFYPHRHLLPEEHGTQMKTGTLGGIYSLAGYLPGKKPRYFVIMLNQANNHRDSILRHLLEAARKGDW